MVTLCSMPAGYTAAVPAGWAHDGSCNRSRFVYRPNPGLLSRFASGFRYLDERITHLRRPTMMMSPMQLPISILLAIGALIGVAGGCSESVGPRPTREVQTPPTPVSPGFSGGYQIHLADATGAHLRQIATGTWPEWSPDGSRVAFTGTDAGIVIIDVDGTDARRLTTGSLPRWSPDGGKIAFVTCNPDTIEDDGPFPMCEMTFSVIDVDGSGERRLGGAGVAVTIKPPAWSPDGSKIAFIAGEGGDRAVLYVVNRDGSGTTRLTQLGTVRTGVDWSPDGQQLAIGAGGSVYVVNADGSDLTELTRQPDSLVVRSVVYSPLGDRIAFSSSLDPLVSETTDKDSLTIHVINADGTHRTSVATHAVDPRWLRDGRTLSFGRWFVDGIWTVSADGGEPSLLVAGGFGAAWSPDGTRLAYLTSD
jgi:Tol biopolymer transport system component